MGSTIGSATYTRLLNEAQAAARQSHCPYSGQAKGAALLTNSGQIFCGCLVESVSFPATVCAEAAAVAAAICQGERKLLAIALWPRRWPCGQCRQMLVEFDMDIEIVIGQTAGCAQVVTLREIMPYAFTPERLDTSAD